MWSVPGYGSVMLARSMMRSISHRRTRPARVRMHEQFAVAESLVYALVSMILLREEAQRAGNAQALRELAVVAQRETGKGFDLKAMRLTDRGLVPRG